MFESGGPTHDLALSRTTVGEAGTAFVSESSGSGAASATTLSAQAPRAPLGPRAPSPRHPVRLLEAGRAAIRLALLRRAKMIARMRARRPSPSRLAAARWLRTPSPRAGTHQKKLPIRHPVRRGSGQLPDQSADRAGPCPAPEGVLGVVDGCPVHSATGPR
eukprot:scaffold2882_cov434-Prasinococcus_capsulatus_cf.AAC.5